MTEVSPYVTVSDLLEVSHPASYGWWATMFTNLRVLDNLAFLCAEVKPPLPLHITGTKSSPSLGVEFRA